MAKTIPAMKTNPDLYAWVKQYFPRELTAANKRRLNKLSGDIFAQERLLAQMAKIMKMVGHPRIRAGFLRAYLRIYANKINKDGRHGSLIIEITKRCNQKCRHCYSRAQTGKSMKDATLKAIIKLARKNYKHIFITGGEPVLDKRVLTVARSNPDIMFFMFTNASKISRAYAKKLSSLGNLIPVLSIDGSGPRQHDYFKGKGSFSRLQRAIRVLNAAKMSWGYLSMVTNINARQVLSKRFVSGMKNKGAILARYLEYIPVGPGARAALVPSAQTYYLLEKRKQEIIANSEIYMQETAQKKCLGLIFFDVDGNIKCCPFFHYSKHNLSGGNLESAVRDSEKDWCQVEYSGECPLYSDQEGLKKHLLLRGWQPTASFNPGNAITAQLSGVMSDHYRKFLKLKALRSA